MRRHITSPLAAALLVAAAACGASRAEIITRTATGIDAARSAAIAADERMQDDIVIKAAERERAEVKKAEGREAALSIAAEIRRERDLALADHRKTRDAATRAYQAAMLAVAAAALEPSDLNMRRLTELAAAAVAALGGNGP